jgi:TatD DNase family protein
MLIDSHCHLDAAYFPEGPDEVLARGRAAGIVHFVVIGVGADASAATNAIALAGAHRDVSATVGMHPHEAKELDAPLLAELERLAAAPRVVAIGEVGLDHHYMHSPAEVQAAVFRTMIGLAKARGLPLVIHTRSAPEETLAILEEEGAREVGGIIHCFSEERGFARRALDLDFDLSFSGIVTFKTAEAIKDVARWAPSDRIMLETDSPYLAPLPLRGKRNEPAHVVHTARFIAELRGERFEDLAAATAEVVKKRLRLDLGAGA